MTKKQIRPKTLKNIEKRFVVTIKIDPWKARGWKDDVYDWDAYPNWEYSYQGDEQEFVKVLIRELKKHNQYSGITIKVEELKGEEVNA